MVAGAAVLVVVAFRAPVAGTVGDSALDTADGAAIVAAGPGVTSPPQEQPRTELAVPTAGQDPTQVVVVSIDGGCETRDGTIRRFLDTGEAVGARMTFFLSGLCLLPDDQRTAYQPPGKAAGQSDVPFADASMVSRRIRVFGQMYRAGHEIGTHFLGHFCGDDGVATWSADQWRDEIAQARRFVDLWPQYNPLAAGAPQLPFDSSVMRGTRTPCLLGDRAAMHAAFAAEGMRYEASDPGVLQWPQRSEDSGLWLFPLPALRLADTQRWVLSMDYNLLVNQNDGRTTGDEATCQRVAESTYRTYMDALRALHRGNRAPLVVGSHLNDWLCGAYITAIERFLSDAAREFPDVRFINFADLADWLDAMPAGVLAGLQERPPQRY
jgi:hypothetical protein